MSALVPKRALQGVAVSLVTLVAMFAGQTAVLTWRRRATAVATNTGRPTAWPGAFMVSVILVILLTINLGHVFFPQLTWDDNLTKSVGGAALAAFFMWTVLWDFVRALRGNTELESTTAERPSTLELDGAVVFLPMLAGMALAFWGWS